MQLLYLTPSSISTLTQFILAFSIAAYLWYLSRRIWRQKKNPITTMLLAAAFSFAAGYILLLFLNASLHPYLRFYAMPLEGPAIALVLLFSLQFAYRFPSSFHSTGTFLSLSKGSRQVIGKAWEARLVLGLTIIYRLARPTALR